MYRDGCSTSDGGVGGVNDLGCLTVTVLPLPCSGHASYSVTQVRILACILQMPAELRACAVGSIILTLREHVAWVLPRLQSPRKFDIFLVSLLGCKKVINNICSKKKLRDLEPEILILNPKLPYKWIKLYASLNFCKS